ncbi:MAG: acetyl-CoA carboxylase, biotin carboxyl carrier protein [Gammaproteobacteria bacterium RIFCSPHIGHO2_12_FULL_37_14]|nr:MAG: acetyl-CoA carboxylase, biotin carboxyl carrier protein [Gammaproteobacteria bacterium RIFCSPHIGHO2_12_FULL_37_14]
MDIRKIKKLIELIQKTGVAEIEIREGEESVRITRETKMPTMMMASPMPPVMSHVESKIESHTNEPHQAGTEKHTVKAPMVGTVYLSPTPGAKPFVEIGQTVKLGDIICLIEAMKMFNQIEADKAGTITSRLVDNGTPVEFHQPLFIIE